MVGGVEVVEGTNKCKIMGWYVASGIILNIFPPHHGKFQASLFPTFIRGQMLWKKYQSFHFEKKSLPREELRLRVPHEGIIKWVMVIEMHKILDKGPFLFFCRKQQN